MAAAILRDARGRRRSACTLPGYNTGRAPGNKGREYPPRIIPVEDVVAALRACPDDRYGRRLRALIILLWRSGLRISEALDLDEHDLCPRDFAVAVRHGKGDKARIAGMDPWAWEMLEPWFAERKSYPLGPVFCVLDGPTAGRRLRAGQVRHELRRLQQQLKLRTRLNPHAFRHSLAIEWLREGVPLKHITDQLGHANIAVTDTYLSGISPEEVLTVAAARRPPVMSISHLLGAA